VKALRIFLCLEIVANGRNCNIPIVPEVGLYEKLQELYEKHKGCARNTMPTVAMEEILRNVTWPPSTLTKSC
jgi:hypothetical protein